MAVENTNRGPEIIISRSHPNFVRRLFEVEVSEIADRTVEILTATSLRAHPGLRATPSFHVENKEIPMHDSCMATKTISLELDAYERLKAAKGPGDSFSDVVRRATFPKKALTAQDLLEQLQRRGPMFSESDLKDLEKTHEKLSTLPDDPWRTSR